MLKIRLKRLGAKKAPTYRIIVINSTTKREGKPVEELGHYNPKTKVMQLNKTKAEEWISKGAQPTETVNYLIKNCKADGTLNYKKKDTVKLSKKAQAKAAAEAEAKAKAEEEAKAAAAAEAEAKAKAEAEAKEETKTEETAETTEETIAE
ncbi:MAG: 30S ribosomal protein S16 [Candidatus Gastranaerophilales bacterium]|nr:30S ribosomal protein S16 [Candidatus Gastranaerophilales bacterium]